MVSRETASMHSANDDSQAVAEVGETHSPSELVRTASHSAVGRYRVALIGDGRGGIGIGLSHRSIANRTQNDELAAIKS
jgi:hypothetical protein